MNSAQSRVEFFAVINHLSRPLRKQSILFVSFSSRFIDCCHKCDTQKLTTQLSVKFRISEFTSYWKVQSKHYYCQNHWTRNTLCGAVTCVKQHFEKNQESFETSEVSKGFFEKSNYCWKNNQTAETLKIIYNPRYIVKAAILWWL